MYLIKFFSIFIRLISFFLYKEVFTLGSSDQVIRYFRIDNEIARGVLLGTSAHGAGTSKAFELSSVTGTISSVSMILAAIMTLCAAPILLSFMS